MIEAGQRATVFAKWAVPNRVGTADFAVYVGSGDSSRELLPLTGSIGVRDVLRFRPEKLDFGELCPGMTVDEIIELNGFDNPLPASIRLLPQAPSSDIRVMVVDRSSGHMRVRVEVTGIAHLGDKDYEVCFDTGDAKQPVIKVPVHVNHLGPYRLDPSDMLINRPRAGTAKYVRVLACGGATPDVEKVEVLPRGLFDVRIAASREGVMIALSPIIVDSRKGTQTGEIQVFVRGEADPVKMGYCLVW